MRPLDRLRWKLTAWYVATFGAILVAFSVGLFLMIRHSIAGKMDRSLAYAAAELRDHVGQRAIDGSGPVALKIPDRALYLFDSAGTLIVPDTASVQVRRAARDAAGEDEVSRQFDIGHEHTLLVHALRFRAPDGHPLVALAAADTEELEDEYAELIAIVSIALGLALFAVAVGGYILARRSSAPVEESFERMRRFTADAAHELRTPIAFLRAHSDLALERDRSAGEYAEALHEVGGEASRLGTIVDDLFTLARADAGERRLAAETTFLDDIALNAVDSVQAFAARRRVSVQITEFEETRVTGDSRLLAQLLRIVLDNAIKYTPAGGAVTLEVSVRDGRAQVTVDDTGIGISAADLPRIFDRFYRGAGARDASEGAGLGLSIAQWVAEAHGGCIEVTSRLGLGTRVCITMPAATVATNAEPNRMAPTVRATARA